jgi:hypothetical protein
MKLFRISLITICAFAQGLQASASSTAQQKTQAAELQSKSSASSSAAQFGPAAAVAAPLSASLSASSSSTVGQSQSQVGLSLSSVAVGAMPSIAGVMVQQSQKMDDELPSPGAFLAQAQQICARHHGGENYFKAVQVRLMHYCRTLYQAQVGLQAKPVVNTAATHEESEWLKSYNYQRLDSIIEKKGMFDHKQIKELLDQLNPDLYRMKSIDIEKMTLSELELFEKLKTALKMLNEAEPAALEQFEQAKRLQENHEKLDKIIAQKGDFELDQLVSHFGFCNSKRESLMALINPSKAEIELLKKVDIALTRLNNAFPESANRFHNRLIAFVEQNGASEQHNLEGWKSLMKAGRIVKSQEEEANKDFKKKMEQACEILAVMVKKADEKHKEERKARFLKFIEDNKKIGKGSTMRVCVSGLRGAGSGYETFTIYTDSNMAYLYDQIYKLTRSVKMLRGANGDAYMQHDIYRRHIQSSCGMMYVTEKDYC